MRPTPPGTASEPTAAPRLHCGAARASSRGSVLECGGPPLPLPTSLGGLSANPNGIATSSPGWRACELPWVLAARAFQPQRGCGLPSGARTQPRWGWRHEGGLSQGSSCLATLWLWARIPLGFRESRPDLWVRLRGPPPLFERVRFLAPLPKRQRAGALQDASRGSRASGCVLAF